MIKDKEFDDLAPSFTGEKNSDPSTSTDTYIKTLINSGLLHPDESPFFTSEVGLIQHNKAEKPILAPFVLVVFILLTSYYNTVLSITTLLFISILFKETWKKTVCFFSWVSFNIILLSGFIFQQ